MTLAWPALLMSNALSREKALRGRLGAPGGGGVAPQRSQDRNSEAFTRKCTPIEAAYPSAMAQIHFRWAKKV